MVVGCGGSCCDGTLGAVVRVVACWAAAKAVSSCAVVWVSTEPREELCWV